MRGQPHDGGAWVMGGERPEPGRRRHRSTRRWPGSGRPRRTGRAGRPATPRAGRSCRGLTSWNSSTKQVAESPPLHLGEAAVVARCSRATQRQQVVEVDQPAGPLGLLVGEVGGRHCRRPAAGRRPAAPRPLRSWSGATRRAWAQPISAARFGRARAAGRRGGPARAGRRRRLLGLGEQLGRAAHALVGPAPAEHRPGHAVEGADGGRGRRPRSVEARGAARPRPGG